MSNTPRSSSSVRGSLLTPVITFLPGLALATGVAWSHEPDRLSRSEFPGPAMESPGVEGSVAPGPWTLPTPDPDRPSAAAITWNEAFVEAAARVQEAVVRIEAERSPGLHYDRGDLERAGAPPGPSEP